MSGVNHTQRAHALLSASGAAKWLNCPPSARMEDDMEDDMKHDETSVFAAEGTLAHEFGDIGLQLFNEAITPEQWSEAADVLRANKLYTDEMEGQVQKYIDYVTEEYTAAANLGGEATLLVEEKIDLTSWVPESFGTGDAGVIGASMLESIDLKYGKGIKVFAKRNSQLMLYALGMLEDAEIFNDIKTVRITIVQPRLDHIDSWDISAEELKKWGNGIVKSKAQEAFDGKGLQKSGPWCKWCKAKPVCATLAADNMKLAQHEFRSPHLLTDEQLLNVYGQIDKLTDWASSVKSYLLSEAVSGKEWPGLKVVEGRANRKWTDEDSVIELMKKSKFKLADFTKTKLVGIGALEKLMSKPKFNAKLSDYVTKPQGSPNLVPLSDGRPAMTFTTAAEEFGEIENEEDLNII